MLTRHLSYRFHGCYVTGSSDCAYINTTVHIALFLYRDLTRGLYTLEMEQGKLVSSIWRNCVVFFFNSVAQCCTDFILCYEKCHPATDDVIEQEGQNLDQISSFSNSKKAQARKKFLNAIQADGNYKLECEIQHWKVRLSAFRKQNNNVPNIENKDQQRSTCKCHATRL